ncbi:hypothetical protein BK004_02725 [bacterium CG10_46_32]|nr:MAG: hypothetical protein BK004_02725 [bacterium CG10_46_32]PIR56060.1 MAG: hypothetical protein COU73_02755 [Parcubacteria group bacterium CG10_big_fil_rev_8_21_14_0_10_46_32]
MTNPRLKTVDKTTPPYPLGKFPVSFIESIGLEIVFMLATSRNPLLEGQEWERIFAKAIDAEWKPSNVGLDDVVKGAFAWGAKTVKSTNPHQSENVRLISGRNNPEFSFQTIAGTDQGIGKQVLEIWNGRVEGIRSKFKEVRTVVLLKPQNFMDDKLAFAVFEFETIRYPVDNFIWKRNKQNNLEGFEQENSEHRFTWQRHGSQFTIKEAVPKNAVKFFVKKPPMLPEKQILELIGYDSSWIEVV